jgi:hypothetical protein
MRGYPATKRAAIDLGVLALKPTNKPHRTSCPNRHDTADV